MNHYKQATIDLQTDGTALSLSLTHSLLYTFVSSNCVNVFSHNVIESHSDSEPVCSKKKDTSRDNYPVGSNTNTLNVVQHKAGLCSKFLFFLWKDVTDAANLDMSSLTLSSLLL